MKKKSKELSGPELESCNKILKNLKLHKNNY